MKTPFLDQVKRYERLGRENESGGPDMGESSDGDWLDVADVRAAYEHDLAAAEKAARADERMSERLRMHRLIDFATVEAEKISADCVAGLKVAKSLVDP